jgi:hypothetical protein
MFKPSQQERPNSGIDAAGDECAFLLSLEDNFLLANGRFELLG